MIRRLSRRLLSGSTLNFALLTVWAFVSLFPIGWLLVMSLKSPEQQFHRPPLLFFRPTISNYVEAFFPGPASLVKLPAGMDLTRYMLNSITIGVAGVLIGLVLAIPAAHALARSQWRFDNLVVYGMLLTRMLPPMAILIPLFLVGNSVRVLDTQLLLALVYGAMNVPFTIFFLIGFFQQVPKEIEEASMIDGLNRLTSLIRITLPLIKPGLAAAVVLALWITWTDLQYALILTSDAAKTMPVAIANLVPEYTELWGIVGAAGFTYTLPMLVFSFFAARHMVRGLTAGAVTG